VITSLKSRSRVLLPSTNFSLGVLHGPVQFHWPVILASIKRRSERRWRRSGQDLSDLHLLFVFGFEFSVENPVGAFPISQAHVDGATAGVSVLAEHCPVAFLLTVPPENSQRNPGALVAMRAVVFGQSKFAGTKTNHTLADVFAYFRPSFARFRSRIDCPCAGNHPAQLFDRRLLGCGLAFRSMRARLPRRAQVSGTVTQREEKDEGSGGKYAS
jgi:hypothetical protein